MHNHTVRPFPEFVGDLARKAATAPGSERLAINGASALLPGEILHFAQQPDNSRLQLLLENAVAHRATICNSKLVWDRGMEQVGPDLLALVGYVPEGRNLALQYEREALMKLKLTETNLGWHLVRLLNGAVRISVLKQDVLGGQLISLFQEQENFEARKRDSGGATRELWITGGSAEIAIELGIKGKLAALKFRFRRSDMTRCWTLPPSLGSELLPRFKELTR